MLPKIKHPTFTLELPISKKKIKFRPMLVKEEKILLMAKEGNSDTEILENLKAIIQNCVYEKLDLDNMPLVEVEYIFLNLRSKSINNIISVRVTDPYDRNIVHEVDVDLDNVKIKQKEIDTIIKIQDSVGMKMKLPTLNTLKRIDKAINMDDINLITLKDSIDTIFDSENSYRAADIPEEELNAFLDNLSTKHIDMLKNFFDNLPKLDLRIEYIDSRGNTSYRTLDTFHDFFH
jgi:hypothetical protein